MNLDTFFNAIRPAFGSLNVKQVDGMIALIDAGKKLPLHHMANVLAQVRRETGGYMYPIKETVFPSHKEKNPSDATVIARLDKAFAAGKLPWVTSPYWRDGWFGRGQIQLTHKANYAKFGIINPANALRPNVSAHVAVKGMVGGMFTGKKLADYNFPEALDAPPKLNPRRIVNGQDGSDREVAHFHRQFASALSVAGWPRLGSSHVNKTPKTEHEPGNVSKKPGILWPSLAALVALAAGTVWQWGADLVNAIERLLQ
jgi:hypothetical protein